MLGVDSDLRSAPEFRDQPEISIRFPVSPVLEIDVPLVPLGILVIIDIGLITEIDGPTAERTPHEDGREILLDRIIPDLASGHCEARVTRTPQSDDYGAGLAILAAAITLYAAAGHPYLPAGASYQKSCRIQTFTSRRSTSYSTARDAGPVGDLDGRAPSGREQDGHPAGGPGPCEVLHDRPALQPGGPPGYVDCVAPGPILGHTGPIYDDVPERHLACRDIENPIVSRCTRIVPSDLVVRLAIIR